MLGTSRKLEVGPLHAGPQLVCGDAFLPKATVSLLWPSIVPALAHWFAPVTTSSLFLFRPVASPMLALEYCTSLLLVFLNPAHIPIKDLFFKMSSAILLRGPCVSYPDPDQYGVPPLPSNPQSNSSLFGCCLHLLIWNHLKFGPFCVPLGSHFCSDGSSPGRQTAQGLWQSRGGAGLPSELLYTKIPSRLFGSRGSPPPSPGTGLGMVWARWGGLLVTEPPVSLEPGRDKIYYYQDHKAGPSFNHNELSPRGFLFFM